MDLQQYLPHTTSDQDFDAPDDVETSTTELVLATGIAIVAGVAARNLMKSGWRYAAQQEPPQNPASDEVAWREALLWAAITGAVVGVTRIVGRRAASGAYRRYF